MHKDFYDPVSAPYLKPLNDRRVALVTGANSGLGWFTVLHLYLHGYVVYIAGRNLSRVRAAITAILIEANKRVQSYTYEERKARRRGEIHFIYMDLAKLQTVYEAVRQFCSIEQKLHILINNAGVMAVPFEITEDGYELQFQVNFLGHFILTQKLLPCLLEVAKDPAEKAKNSFPRVVNLSSIAHHFSYKYFKTLDPIKKTPGFLYSWVRYGRSKTCLIHFTKELTDKYPDILSIAIHPGVITNTKLFNYWKSIVVIGPIAKAGFKTFDFVNGITPEEGSFASLRAAMDPTLTRFEHSGIYMVTGGREDTPSKIASDNTYAKESYDMAMKIMKDFEVRTARSAADKSDVYSGISKNHEAWSSKSQFEQVSHDDWSSMHLDDWSGKSFSEKQSEATSVKSSIERSGSWSAKSRHGSSAFSIKSKTGSVSKDWLGPPYIDRPERKERNASDNFSFVTSVSELSSSEKEALPDTANKQHDYNVLQKLSYSGIQEDVIEERVKSYGIEPTTSSKENKTEGKTASSFAEKYNLSGSFAEKYGLSGSFAEKYGLNEPLANANGHAKHKSYGGSSYGANNVPEDAKNRYFNSSSQSRKAYSSGDKPRPHSVFGENNVYSSSSTGINGNGKSNGMSSSQGLGKTNGSLNSYASGETNSSYNTYGIERLSTNSSYEKKTNGVNGDRPMSSHSGFASYGLEKSNSTGQQYTGSKYNGLKLQYALQRERSGSWSNKSGLERVHSSSLPYKPIARPEGQEMSAYSLRSERMLSSSNNPRFERERGWANKGADNLSGYRGYERSGSTSAALHRS